MTRWALKQHGQVIPWHTLLKITADQIAPSNEVDQKKRAVFDADIYRILGYYFSLPVDGMHFGTRDAIEEESDKFYGPTPFWDNGDEVPR